jgi:sterol desaturase/sphingolipid hydroxylase (fatty acid hydroxylase superfamily)
MDWTVAIGDYCLQTLGWLAVLAVVFGILGRLTPCNRGMHWWRDVRALATDLLYWFLGPLVARVGRAVLLAAVLALLCGGRSLGFAKLATLPVWQQCLALLLVQDVMLYWIHRVFHTPPAWRFHAVHHSPRVLDWASASRFHLVNTLLSFVLVDVAALLAGFAPAALVALAPFNTIYSCMVHANLNWTFGPLRFVLASPVFHRWHHAAGTESQDKNFASTFPILDLIFGTYYMPDTQLPEHFGNGQPDFPEDFWGQLLAPFRRRVAQSAQRPGQESSPDRRPDHATPRLAGPQAKPIAR